jgi:conjugal transfer mating pair stabilization protein TraG
VAEQRSENEHKINESAGEIDKKQSTVQASSDILKGENLIGQGRFKLGRKEAEDQSSKLNPFNDLQPDELQQRVAELRKKTGGGK